MRRYELLLARSCSVGIILVCTALLIAPSESLRGSTVVLQAKAKLAEQKAESEAEAAAAAATSNNETTVASNSTKPKLTGIPQIDYVHDPNLPRELNGQNLSDYPFYSELPKPEEIDFKCDGLHDGFYASVAHKCQLYHHCLFGTRFDFLCANYTAFDQKTFICHFVSEVDCDNSPKYFKRNEALYKETSTTTTSTTTRAPPTTTTTTTTAAPPEHSNSGGGGMRRGSPGRRRRPYRRRRPMYEYYYDDEEYPDADYYEDEVAAHSHRRGPNRKHGKEPYDNHGHDTEPAEYETPQQDQVKPAVRSPTISRSTSIYERPRIPPKIRRPVPKNERDKYDYKPAPKTSTAPSTVPPPPEKPTSTASPSKKSSTTTQPPATPADEEYYEDEEEYEYEEPRPTKPKHHVADYDFEDSRRRPGSRHRGRQQPPSRKRTEVYEDDYDTKERPRLNRRKEYTSSGGSRYDERPRGRPNFRSKSRHEEHPQGHQKKRVMEGDYQRRPEKRPVPMDDYYYDDEEPPVEEEEVSPNRNHRRPVKPAAKPKPSLKLQSQGEHTESGGSKPADTTPRYPKVTNPAPPRTFKTYTPEHETEKENEILTTENASGSRTTQRYKTVKIVNTNSIREDANELVDLSPTEETRFPTRPPANMVIKSAPKIEFQRPLEKLPKNISMVRHFVVMTPSRKPSHFGYEAAKLPEPKLQQDYRPSSAAAYIKEPIVSLYPNQSYHQQPNFSPPTYYMPMEQRAPQVKPIEEHLAENLNAISPGLNHHNTHFITEPKPFETTKSQPPYRYTDGDRLYTNTISFPHRPPATFDITAPGPSALAEETDSSQDRKYSEVPNYTANGADYDVTYNDALQPSTLHPVVRRLPSTSFYMQQSQQAGRHPAEFAFNESARSQNRYK